MVYSALSRFVNDKNYQIQHARPVERAGNKADWQNRLFACLLRYVLLERARSASLSRYRTSSLTVPKNKAKCSSSLIFLLPSYGANEFI